MTQEIIILYLYVMGYYVSYITNDEPHFNHLSKLTLTLFWPFFIPVVMGIHLFEWLFSRDK